MGKKSVIISAGISVALFATVLTVSLVNNTRTNEKLDSNISDVKKDNETLKNETQASLKDLEGKLNSAKTALEAADKQLTEADAALKSALEKSIEDAKAKIKETTDALAEADKTLTSDLAAQLEKINKNITDIAAANKSIEDQKTELTNLLNAAKTELTKTITDLSTKTDEKTKALTDQIKGLSDSYDTLNSTLNTKVDTEDFKALQNAHNILQRDVDDAEKEITDLWAELENVATVEEFGALKAKIEGEGGVLERLTAVEKSAKDAGIAIGKLEELTTAQGENITKLQSDVKSLTDIVSEGARSTKVGKINEIFTYYYSVYDSMSDSMDEVLKSDTKYNISINGEKKELTAKTKIEKLRELETALTKGLVNLTLSSTADVDNVIKEMQDNMKNISEEVLVVCGQANFKSDFENYRKELLEKVTKLENITDETRNAVTAKITDYNEVNNVDLNKLDTTEKIANKLEELKLAILKMYINDGELVSKINSAVNNVNALGTASEDYKKSVVTEIEAIKVVETELGEGEVATIKQFEADYNVAYTNISKFVALATNQDSEDAAYAEFVKKLAEYRHSDAGDFISDDEVAEAKKEFEDIINEAGYDYAVGKLPDFDTLTVDEIKAVYTKESERLAVVSQKWADIRDVRYLQQNSNKDFVNALAGLNKVIDGTDNYTVKLLPSADPVEYTKTLYLNDTEKAHFKGLLNSITMKDLTAVDVTKEEILEEVGVINTLIEKVMTLTKAYDYKIGLTATGRTVASDNLNTTVDGFDTTTIFTTSEIAKIKEEIKTVAAKDEFKFDIDDLDAEASADDKKATLNANIDVATIKANLTALDNAAADLLNKYGFVTKAREFKSKEVATVNSDEYKTILGEYVQNSFGIKFNDLKTFYTDEIGDVSIDSKKAEADYKLYVGEDGEIVPLANQAKALHDALKTRNTYVETINGYLEKANGVVRPAEGFTAGLTQTEIDERIGKMDKPGNSSILYYKMYDADGNYVSSVLSEYNANSSAVYDEATALWKTRKAGLLADQEYRTIYADELVKVYGEGTKYQQNNEKYYSITAEEWAAYVTEVEELYTTNEAYYSADEATVATKKAAFRTAFDSVITKVKANYATKDASFKLKEWNVYGTNPAKVGGEVNQQSKIEKVFLNARVVLPEKDSELLTLLKNARTALGNAEYSFDVERIYNEQINNLAKKLHEFDSVRYETEEAALTAINGWANA